MSTGLRLFDLNPQQADAATHTVGPLLILAGAGTGKTRVITARIAYLIETGTAPENILAVTFTNKAANEMRERVSTLIPKEAAKKITLSTFHALCLRILRVGIEALGYKKNFTIYDQSDQLSLIRKIITRISAKDENLEPALAKNMISKAKNSSWRPPTNDQTLIGAVFLRYEQELKALNAVDFDDLLLLAVRLLAEHPEQRAQWESRYRQIMVDEFQDTNRLQLELVSLLGSGHRNVCVVGDDDQSIYGWRGAEVSNILEFETHFSDPKVVKLEQNYRSTNLILEAANGVIRNNARRRVKKLWSAQGDGERVRVIGMPDDRKEAEFICEDFARRQAAEALPWEDFAVLYRMNAQSRLIEENLRRLKIPYRLVGGQSFYDRREVKDLIACMNVLLNPQDDVSLLRIINTPPRGIGDTTVGKALEHSIHAHCSLFESLQSPDFLSTLTTRAREAISTFADLLDRYETKILEVRSDYAAVVRSFIEETGWMDDLKKSCKTAEEALDRETNVKEMLSAMDEHLLRSEGGLRDYLDSVTLDQDREEKDKEKDQRGVTLITLHAAKGLEFRHVALIGAEEGLLPHDRSKMEGNLDEERRLFYVGITRAMRTLIVSYCLARMRYGSHSPCTPSSFLKELPETSIERVDYLTLMNTPVDEARATLGFAKLREMLSRGG